MASEATADTLENAVDLPAPDSPNYRYFFPEGREAAVAAFEEPEREGYQEAARVVEALRIEPGMTVVDLGAGSGYFTRKFAPEVEPGGRVLAVDIVPEFLEIISSWADEAGFESVDTVLSTPTGTPLEDDSVDLVFLADTYHHLDAKQPMLADFRRILRPGGRLAIVDWHRAANPIFELDGLEWDSHLPQSVDDVISELEGAGFRLLEQHDFVLYQFFLVLESPR